MISKKEKFEIEQKEYRRQQRKVLGLQLTRYQMHLARERFYAPPKDINHLSLKTEDTKDSSTNGDNLLDTDPFKETATMYISTRNLLKNDSQNTIKNENLKIKINSSTLETPDIKTKI